MSSLKTIVIIPARGGSKRLPGKNLLPLGDKSLIGHSIAYAKNNMSFVDAIVVSTDDPAIKKEALSYDVLVIDRPDEISGDQATTVSALQHVLQEMDNSFDTVVLLQVTNPLRPASLFEDAMNLYSNSDCDSVMTVSKMEFKLGKDVDGAYVPYNYVFGQRSQDIEPLYQENGLLYITAASKVKEGFILAEKNLMITIQDDFPIVDIDTESDYRKAQAYIADRRNY